MTEDSQQNLREALKRVAVALKQIGIPFALMGGYAVWARGGPEPEHDVDFMVAAEDAEKAADLLVQKELRVERPPEDWLFKVYTDDGMVDVIFRASCRPAERSVFEEATELEVLSLIAGAVRDRAHGAEVERARRALLRLRRGAPGCPRPA